MLTQFVQIFLKLHGSLKSNKTLVSYKNSLNHLLPVFGKKRLNTITKMIVKTYMANRGNEGASNSTINNEINCLNTDCPICRHIGKPLVGIVANEEIAVPGVSVFAGYFRGQVRVVEIQDNGIITCLSHSLNVSGS